MRKSLFTVWMVSCTLVYGLILLPSLIAQPTALWAARQWAHGVLFGLRHIVGVRLVISRLETLPTGGALIAAKHQSMLDTIVPFVMFKAPAFILKKELLRIPIFGWYAARAGMIPVDRDGQAAALKALVRATQRQLDAGRQIIIFPEGTRQQIGADPAYKPGVAALYRDLNVDCIPLALHTGHVWPARGMPSHAGVAQFEVLPAIAAGLSRGAFMRTLQEQLDAASTRLASG